MSDRFTVFSSGTTGWSSPAVSPDGTQLAFVEATGDRDVVSVEVATAAVTRLIATQRNEQMPAWAARENALVYVTDRNVALEIWLHRPGQPDRPVVTARDFPADTTQWLWGPSLSPDATRVIYLRSERAGPTRLWMSNVAGGSPVPLMETSTGDQPGSWSPDGRWYVYWHLDDGRTSLNRVRTTGQGEPDVLRADVQRSGRWVPVWSPAGDWILHDDRGVQLISPDGATTRELSSADAAAYAFSADGQTVYGIRGISPEQAELFSMRVGGGEETRIGVLGAEFLPSGNLRPALRLSLTPDGTRLTYSTATSTSNLWLADGLDAVTLP